MTDGEVSAREDERASHSTHRIGRRRLQHHSLAASGAPAMSAAVADNVPGQNAIREFLHLQSTVPCRSLLARIFGVSPLVPETRTWYHAATSEIAVGEELGRLDPEWLVLHALPVAAGSDIDHLVIGPGGVFILNTKSHPGQTIWASQRSFLVSGMRHPYIRNMEYEMGRAERLLTIAAQTPVEVAGVLVVVAARSITVRDKHRDVTVLPSSAVLQWILARPRVLTPGDVARIGAATKRDSTWYARSSTNGVDHATGDAGDKHDLLARFAAHRAEVRRAWRLQVTWATGTAIAGATGFILVTYSILVSALASLANH
jgi:hypothetical protein